MITCNKEAKILFFGSRIDNVATFTNAALGYVFVVAMCVLYCIEILPLIKRNKFTTKSGLWVNVCADLKQL